MRILREHPPNDLVLAHLQGLDFDFTFSFMGRESWTCLPTYSLLVTDTQVGGQ